MPKFILTFIGGLIAAVILAAAAASANSTTAYANFDIRNKSDQCVFWNLPTKRDGTRYGTLRPGESSKEYQIVGNAFGSATSAKIEAKIQDCGTHHQIGPVRYDYIPVNSRSELSIHKQSPGVYIMRHGP
jgi:hypothetical protein